VKNGIASGQPSGNSSSRRKVTAEKVSAKLRIIQQR
jgi:hypothetical protein